MKIGKYIHARRKELKMTQLELAAKVGYTGETTISRIEHGDRNVPMAQLEKFADALDCSIESLLGIGESVDCDFSLRLSNGDTVYIVKKDDYPDGCYVLFEDTVWQAFRAKVDGYMLIADRHTRHTDGSAIQGEVIARLIRYEV